MTVLTLSFVATKPDTVPLVDDVHHESANARYEPKLLEAGSGRSSTADAPDLWPVFKWSVLKALLFSLTFAVVYTVVTRYIYWPFGTNVIEYKVQSQWNVEADVVASVPFKSYTSNADAENDMSMPPSAASAADSDYDASQFNFMGIEYKKLENGALKSNENDVISTPDESYEFYLKFSSIPSSLIVKPAPFIHDFRINVTGIIDVEGKRCYVMPLLPGMVSPPESMNELLFKISSGYYSKDINKVIAQMTMLKPELTNLSDYGSYISKVCANLTTYKLDTTGLNTKDIVFV